MTLLNSISARVSTISQRMSIKPKCNKFLLISMPHSTEALTYRSYEGLTIQEATVLPFYIDWQEIASARNHRAAILATSSQQIQ